MTLAEIKHEAADLPFEQRFELQAFLADLDADRQEDFQKIVSKRMKRMDMGEKVSLAEVEARHETLKALGL